MSSRRARSTRRASSQAATRRSAVLQSVQAGLALRAGHVAASASRRLGRGAGATVSGLIGLKIAPELLSALAGGRHIAVVSATNGKTTTTAMLAAALATDAPVLSNAEGSNLARGVLAALMTDPHGRHETCVFEVDELALDVIAQTTAPGLFVLGNLSRDQLDRMTEVQALSDRWQRMLADVAVRARSENGSGQPPVVVANADDPLVAAAVMPLTESADAAVQVVWVGAGQLWTADSASCPRCAALWARQPDYFCARCGFARPATSWDLVGHDLVGPDGMRRTLELSLPGRANRANAALAVAAASVLGIDVDAAVHAIRAISDVGGRYARRRVGGVEARLLLAKNPAGWQEMLAQGREETGDGGPVPVVLVLNAQGPDGKDTSWIWDVPFEDLKGRRVVVSGQRAQHLAVRLRYAEVDFQLCDDALQAVEDAARGLVPPTCVDVIANYTAFTDLRARLDKR